MLCMLNGTLYGLGVLRLFRWGQDLKDPRVYGVAVAIQAVIMRWAIYRQKAVQDEYDASDYNPINASLSY